MTRIGRSLRAAISAMRERMSFVTRLMELAVVSAESARVICRYT